MSVDCSRPGERSVASQERVTLIRPPIVSSKGAMSDPVVPPVGLGYLAGVLARAGISVSVIDATIGEDPHAVTVHDGYVLHGLGVDEIVQRVPGDTTLIGLSCMFSQDWPSHRRLIQALRRRFPEALLMAGGEHVSALTEFCLRDCPELDACVRGEGEETLLEFVERRSDRRAWRDVAGIAFLEDGAYVQAPPRKRIRSVSEIPRPAWDLFPMEAYVSTGNAFGVNRGRSIGIVATRGCPYECTFCSNPSMYGRSWLARDPDDVLDEIESYIDRYRIQNVDFFDLTMVLKRQWILDFCRKIEERRLAFTWQLPSGTRSEVIDDEVAQALFRTGCRNVTFAPESGSAETLEIIKKKVKLDRLTGSIRTALERGIVVRVNLIIGFPHETHRHVLATLGYALRLALIGVHDAGIYQFSPYPGTQLFDELRASGKIGALDDDYFRSLLNYKSFSVSGDFCGGVGPLGLALYRTLGMSAFFALSFARRPARLIRLVKNLAGRRGETALETRLGAILRRRYRREGDAAGMQAPSAEAAK
jgi:anaerobic magnesium-protoporphyrin IX monomethyl ester cyclase